MLPTSNAGIEDMRALRNCERARKHCVLLLRQKWVPRPERKRPAADFRDRQTFQRYVFLIRARGDGVYLIVSLRGRPSIGMTTLMIGGGIVLMGIALATYAVYKFIKQSRS